jgi:hypothetical protein
MGHRVSAGLARRLSRLEMVAAADAGRRWHAAMRVLGATMTPEHIALVRAWDARPEVRADFTAHPRDPLLVRILRLDPPALVRAVTLMVTWHVLDGTPLSFPDYVAEVYVRDPDAIPGLACDRCGYYMPVRGRLLPTGQIAYGEEGYFGPCPVCSGYRNGQADREDQEDQDR